MMARGKHRTAECNRADARKRLRDAEGFLEIARMTAQEPDDDQMSYTGVAAALAVLAGIAASDAPCCAALGVRSRGQSHRDAVDTLAGVASGGSQQSQKLASLIDLKDSAHYGLISIGQGDLARAMRSAESLVKFARDRRTMS